MTTTKLKIDLQQGLLDVEGSEQFVREIYTDFKDQLHVGNRLQNSAKPKVNQPHNQTKPDKEPVAVKSKKRSSSGSGQQTTVKDLDLSGKGAKVERLKDFHALFKISSNMERNLVFVYYLQNKLEISPITPNHIFTCYRDVGVKVPAALVQSLRDSASRQGWIDTANTNDIKVTVPGINYLEHDLARSKPE